MPTIIDSLLVKLKLGSEEFEKGIEKSLEAKKKFESKVKHENKSTSEDEKKLAKERLKRDKELEERRKHIVEGLRTVREETLELLALFTGGYALDKFAEHTILLEASLNRTSANLGMATQDLAEYRLANEKAGGSAEGMVQQLQQAASDVANLKLGKGPSEAMQNFFRWGGSAKDVKDVNSYLKARADIIHRMFEVDPIRAHAIATSMGVSEDTFNLMKRGAAGIDRMKESQRGLAAAQAANAAQAERFRQQMVTFDNTVLAIGTNILTGLMPVLEVLRKFLMHNVADWFKEHRSDAHKWAQVMSAGVKQFVSLVQAMLPIVSSAITVLMEVLKNVWPLVQMVLGQLVAALKFIGPTVQKSMSQVLGAIKAAMPFITGLINTINQGLGNILKIFGPYLLQIFNVVEEGWNLIFGIIKEAGEFVEKLMPEKFKGVVGEFIANIMASGGDKEAQQALKNSNSIPYILPNINAGTTINRNHGNTDNSVRKTDVKVGDVTIHTQATNADAMAKDMNNSLSKFIFADQANAGIR